MTVNELLDKMTSREISEWMAYDRTCDKDWIESQQNKTILEDEFDPVEQARQVKELLMRGKQ